MKNTLEGINRKLIKKNWISDIENRLVEIKQLEQQKEKRMFKMRII